MFRGALIRNFIFEGAVNDRLFTLLAFVHLGAPLFVVMLMWIHVQRVPRAHINPPRPIWIAVTLTMLVLSLIKPVVSQGPGQPVGGGRCPRFRLVPAADLSAHLRMAAGASVDAADRRQRAAVLRCPGCRPSCAAAAISAELLISVHPDNRTVKARFDEPILDAGLRGEINLPYDCRNGGCGLCKCTVLQRRGRPGRLPARRAQSGRAGAGQGADVLRHAALRHRDRIRAGVRPDAPAVEGIRRHSLQDGDGSPTTSWAWSSSCPRARRFPLPPASTSTSSSTTASAAPSPSPARRTMAHDIELQIRLVPGGRFTTHVFEKMKAGDAIRFEGPLGDFVLRESNRPIVFVAGATGFAPVKSMVEDAFHRGLHRPIHLYWGVRRPEDLYLVGLPEQWAREHANFKFVPVLSEPHPEDNWSGRTGLVHEAILQDFPSLAGNEIYACGSVRMVEAIFPKLKGQGAEEGMCFSDAFTLSARSMACRSPAEEPKELTSSWSSPAMSKTASQEAVFWFAG
jgi:CDP-4-dehydro-6-deoxyglucose reductase